MWVTVTRNEVATVYIDSSAITKLGYNRRVWVVYDLTSPDKTGQQSVKSHIDYDCTEGKYRTISATSHQPRRRCENSAPLPITASNASPRCTRQRSSTG